MLQQGGVGVWVTGVYIVVVLPVLLFYRSLLQLLISLGFEEDKLSNVSHRSLDREEEYVHTAPDPESEGRKERSVV